MQIKEIYIKNFRSIKHLNVSFENLTVIIGENNSGKSSILKAIEVFFDPSPRISDDDYYMRCDDDIEIIISFFNLVPSEIEEFGTAVFNDTLTIKRVFSKSHGKGQPIYETLAKVYPPFSEIRQITSKSEKIKKFNSLRKELNLQIDSAKSADDVDRLMSEWEAENEDKLERLFVRGFFGAPNVAKGKLSKKTYVNFVPASVNFSEEISDKKRSPVVSLMSEISRQVIENNEELSKFKRDVDEKYRNLVSMGSVPQLKNISDGINSILNRYYSDSSVVAEWPMNDAVSFSLPAPIIRVESNSFKAPIDGVGHGLQRAVFLSIIEFLSSDDFLAEKEKCKNFESPASDIIILIEEPELYQHPYKQISMYRSLHDIVERFNHSSGIRFQIIFSTHSEKFISMDKFHAVRVVRRDGGVEGKHSHSVTSLSIGECSKYFAKLVSRRPMSEDAFKAKMHIFTREICEGFFGKKVILVEGVTDKAVLEAYYKHKGIDFMRDGIMIIQVGGKGNLDKPFYIFNSLGIPTYCIFDNDNSSGEHINNIIPKIAGENISKLPKGVFEQFCAMEGDLEEYIKLEIGGGFCEIRKEICKDFGVLESDFAKTPAVISGILIKAVSKGASFSILDDILKKIENLSSLFSNK